MFLESQIHLFNFKWASENPHPSNSASLEYSPVWQTECLAKPILIVFFFYVHNVTVKRLKKLKHIHLEHHKAHALSHHLCHFIWASDPILWPRPLRLRPLTVNHKRGKKWADPGVEELTSCKKTEKIKLSWESFSVSQTSTYLHLFTDYLYVDKCFKMKHYGKFSFQFSCSVVSHS